MRPSLLLLFAVSLVAGCADSSSSGGADGAPPAGAPASGPAADSDSCEPPPVRPTYLPWLPERQPPPDPEVSHGPADATDLVWAREDSTEAYYVLLR